MGKSTASPPPPPPKGRSWGKIFGRVTLATVLGGAAYVGYHSYDRRHPGKQLPHDPSLPTVVVVGNGWASTAFLKELDNENYNVVSSLSVDSWRRTA